MKMRWYDGNIAEAVSLSKQRDSVFVVYVDGKDEQSTKLRNFIDEDKIRNQLESEHFVAIKIDAGSESYMQFAQIYQLVPLPSLFFIGKNGSPIQVVTAVIGSSDELEQKIKIVLETVGIKEINTSATLNEQTSTSTAAKKENNAVSASQNFIANEQASNDDFEVVCEGDVCYRKPKSEAPSDADANIPSTSQPQSDTKPETVATIPLETPPTTPTSSPTTSTTPAISSVSADTPKSNSSDDVTARMEQAKKLIEEKRIKKEGEEKRLDREREIRRRKEGQEMLNFKQTQRDQELQEMKDSIRRDKIEEQAARQRILEKIASDRAEQAQRFSSPEKPKPTDTETVQQPATPASSSSSDSSRIQFRKPEGETETHTFKSTDEFKVVRDYIRNTLLAGTSIREFSLATTFPRREFTTDDDSKTLQELGLCPSAVLLVIAGQRAAHSPSAIVARSGGFVNMFNMVFWGVLSPFFTVFNYLRNWISGRRPDTTASTGAQKRISEETVADNDAAKRRNIDRLLNRNLVNDEPSASTSDKAKKDAPYRRVGGSNIHRLRENKDSDDENNTWNGNSTQQQ